jgi:hypothetical protein
VLRRRFTHSRGHDKVTCFGVDGRAENQTKGFGRHYATSYLSGRFHCDEIDGCDLWCDIVATAAAAAVAAAAAAAATATASRATTPRTEACDPRI